MNSTMTIKKFCELLRGLNQQWYLCNGIEIRNEHGQCPITAVFADKPPLGVWFTPGEKPLNAAALTNAHKLGLDTADAHAIIHAADGRLTTVRCDLLDACGLEEDLRATEKH